MKALMTAFLAWGFLTTWNLQAASIDWIREYNGPGNDPDRVAAIATAQDGSVVVAGTSTIAGTLDDFVVIKFAPSGDTLWVRYVDNPVGNSETCVALTIDSEGSIVVGGSTYSTASQRDFLVAKLNRDGEMMWLRTFDGAAHAEDQLSAVETDIAGNVFVTGSSATTAGWPALEDYATIKYSSTGEELWVRFYNGGGEGDLANDVDVDTAGNVYVTGRSNTSPVIPGIYCATVKYRPDGTTDWVRTAYDAAPNT